jgi:hypothetical protein
MKKYIYLALILIVETFIAAIGCVQPDYTVTVKGMVIDAGKQVGVSGVTVSAGTYSATTDDNGEYMLMMPSGSATFTVDASGYKRQDQWIMIGEEKTCIMNFGLIDRFHTTGIVQGTVANSKTSNPIEGAQIVIVGNGRTYQVESMRFGAYAIELPLDLMSGSNTYLTNVTATGYPEFSTTIVPVNGSYRIANILMKPNH